jgi:hypothetical protein
LQCPFDTSSFEVCHSYFIKDFFWLCWSIHPKMLTCSFHYLFLYFWWLRWMVNTID